MNGSCTDSRTSCDTEKENHVEEMDVVESVVNDSVVSNITKELIKLPENLPPDILTIVSQLKAAAFNSESGARSFFNTPSNSKLLRYVSLLEDVCHSILEIHSFLLLFFVCNSKLAEKARLLTTSCRLGVYTYLADFLPCSKDTLMKRGRQLLIEEEEKKIEELLNK